MCAGLGKFEVDEPVAWGAVAIHFRCGEFPAAGGLEREIGEIEIVRPDATGFWNRQNIFITGARVHVIGHRIDRRQKGHAVIH